MFVISLGIVSVLFGGKMDLNSHFADMPWWFILVLVPVGIIAAVALTVPGLSGSLILLILGFYKPLLENTIQWVKEILTVGDFFQHLEVIRNARIFCNRSSYWSNRYF